MNEIASSDVALILLAGGSGQRMRSALPKQYLPVNNKPLVLHALDCFRDIQAIAEAIIVCEEGYRGLFTEYADGVKLLKFASPGARRQDSVYNGMQYVSDSIKYVIVHDGARPLVSREVIDNVILNGRIYGASTAAVPVKATIKTSHSNGFVNQTLNRNTLWEIQTPQCIAKEMFCDAFKHALSNNLDVTDDVSLVEHLGRDVSLVMSDYSNIKVTTPEDLVVVQTLMNKMDAGSQ